MTKFIPLTVGLMFSTEGSDSGGAPPKLLLTCSNTSRRANVVSLRRADGSQSLSTVSACYSTTQPSPEPSDGSLATQL